MLTFLRKIRKSLIDTGSTRKYILYAIGEIALVVIGILIALQINDWNEGRINRITEKEILNRIAGDLETDLKNIELSSLSGEERVLRAVWVIENLGHDASEIKGLDIYQNALQNLGNSENLVTGSMGSTIMEIRFYFLFEESSVTIQEIMSTGKLNIIRDDQIKIAIQSHYAEINKLKYLQRLLITNRDELVGYLLDNNISILNKIDTPILLEMIGSPDKLIAIIENFIDITRVVYRDISAEEGSIKSATEVLLKDIKTYLRTI